LKGKSRLFYVSGLWKAGKADRLFLGETNQRTHKGKKSQTRGEEKVRDFDRKDLGGVLSQEGVQRWTGQGGGKFKNKTNFQW